MSTELLSETLVPLAEARLKFVPRVGKKPVNPATLWRWCHRGLALPDGTHIKLECAYVGRTPMTSREAVARFFTTVTTARLAASAPADDDAETERSPETAAKLAAAGLL